MNIKKIVVTRFSVDYPTSYLNNYSQIEREEWFKNRSKIFKLGTLESIYNNSLIPNEIICIFSEKDSHNYSEFLKDTDVTPLFASYDTYQKVLSDYINTRYDKVMISRIDSDDLIQQDYFEKTLESYLITKNRYQVVVSAIVTNLKNTNLYTFDVSPFISIFHFDNKKKVEIFSFNHHEIKNFNPSFVKTTSWLQIIHNKNLSNKIFNIIDIYSIRIKNILKSMLNNFLNNKYDINIYHLRLQKYDRKIFNNFIPANKIEKFINIIKHY